MDGNLVYSTANPSMLNTAESIAKLATIGTPYVIDGAKQVIHVGDCFVCDMNGNFVKDDGMLKFFYDPTQRAGMQYILSTPESIAMHKGNAGVDVTKIYAFDCVNGQLYADPTGVASGPYLNDPQTKQAVMVMHYESKLNDCYVCDMNGNYVKDTGNLQYFFDTECNQYTLVTSDSVAMHGAKATTTTYLLDCISGKLYDSSTNTGKYLKDSTLFI
jgi:hypothetical protein